MADWQSSTPAAGDVWLMTVTLAPVTRCDPPDGVQCWLKAHPATDMTAMDARRHALDNPGHLVIRETVTRSQYHLDPMDAAAPERSLP